MGLRPGAGSGALSTPALLASALVVGFVHALEPDHVAAVTAFVSRDPRPGTGARHGIRWGVGHALAVLLAGGAVVALELRVPEGASSVLEAAVGAALVGLGVWALRGAREIHLHRRAGDGDRPARVHAHPGGCGEGGHPHPPGEGSGHAATVVGALHGLAGTAPAAALASVTFTESRLAGGGYLLLFGLGTVAGMAVYAFVAGLLYRRAGRASAGLLRGLVGVTGVAGLGVGLLWIARALGTGGG